MSTEIELQHIGFAGNPVVVAPRTSDMNFDFDGDVEGGAMAACRICLECEGQKEDDDLISPCLCKGTQQFVHRSCLDNWRSIREGFAFSHCTTCKAQFHLRVVKLSAHSWPKIKYRLFVARDVFFVFLAIQMVIGLFGSIAYFVDKDGSFRISLTGNWDLLLSAHPIPFFYCVGVICFFVLVGFFGMVFHCLSYTNDPRVVGFQNFCFGWGMLDCFPTSMEVWMILIITGVVIFAVLGLAYGFLVSTMAMQRIFQKHYHILTKKELTQEYVVKDLHGCYTPPELAQEDVDRLTLFKLL